MLFKCLQGLRWPFKDGCFAPANILAGSNYAFGSAVYMANAMCN
jgi:hypothetical protein